MVNRPEEEEALHEKHTEDSGKVSLNRQTSTQGPTQEAARSKKQFCSTYTRKTYHDLYAAKSFSARWRPPRELFMELYFLSLQLRWAGTELQAGSEGFLLLPIGNMLRFSSPRKGDAKIATSQCHQACLVKLSYRELQRLESFTLSLGRLYLVELFTACPNCATTAQQAKRPLRNFAPFRHITKALDVNVFHESHQFIGIKIYHVATTVHQRYVRIDFQTLRSWVVGY